MISSLYCSLLFLMVILFYVILVVDFICSKATLCSGYLIYVLLVAAPQASRNSLFSWEEK